MNLQYLDHNYRLYLVAREQLDWWQRYDKLGPTGGIRQRLLEAITNYEQQLITENKPLAKQHMNNIALEMKKHETH